jgi:hypothetical protein
MPPSHPEAKREDRKKLHRAAAPCGISLNYFNILISISNLFINLMILN